MQKLSFSQADDVHKPDHVILADEQAKFPLGLHLEFLEGSSGQLTIVDCHSNSPSGLV